MGTKWNGNSAYRAIEAGAAKGLLAAATLFFNAQMARTGVANPPPYDDSSKPGEYPRLRTGLGQRGLTMVPTTIAEVMAGGVVRIGYRKGASHLLLLELAKGRLGLQKTLADLRPQLAALATASFKG